MLSPGGNSENRDIPVGILDVIHEMRKGIVRMSSGFSLKFCIFIRQSGHHGSARFPNGRNKMLSEDKLFGFRPLHEM